MLRRYGQRNEKQVREKAVGCFVCENKLLPLQAFESNLTIQPFNHSTSMQYTLLQLSTAFEEPFMNDVLVAELADLGFESFETDQELIKAYIQNSMLDKAKVEQALRDFMFDGIREYHFSACEDKDWNEEWEKHFFEPIVIDRECVIHASFARDVPECKYDIVIDPKMAFGTGHHQTTSLMLSAILSEPMADKCVLDMGCGTAVLAILASMRGASKVVAVDIDDWCVRNAQENIEMNHIDNVEVVLGDSSVLEGRLFDVIIANINRNILLSDMKVYAGCMNIGGKLLLSGFYTDDAELLIEEGRRYGLELVSIGEKDRWCRVMLQKK